MAHAVVAAAARTPIGRASKGSLTGLRADDMAVQVVEAVLRQVPGLPPRAIEDLYLGVAHQTGEQAQNLGRRVAVLLGRDDLPATTVSRACASSLQTTAMAANAVLAGAGAAFLSVGVESVSRYTKTAGPEDRNERFARAAPGVDTGSGPVAQWRDPRGSGALPDVYMSMGQTAENVAALYGVSRDEQDRFALGSQQRYAAAAARGFWQADITPLELPDGSLLDRDDSPRPATTLEDLVALKPVFRPQGTVTAGNACPLNDGAAALLITSDEEAKWYGIRPLARIVASAVTGVSPELMGIGPVAACQRVLARAGMRLPDIDLIEINEAFAAQVIASCRLLGLDPEQVNRNGGAIALGHPFGMTGARMISSLVHALHDTDTTLGLAALCVGGGMGMAVVLERL
ncbi:acetyl-CoA C-acyltransferase [Streptomyces sp. E5N91]|uniref:acetyl-CoA C-acyltransferase n=1 Tax=Streptomyces sp. E5N91 TaxID=1851996 RepID=UPI000EF61EEA|nr:acetyl-CoA C-acyltransferase [Streptomyces sp. E5N91]